MAAKHSIGFQALSQRSEPVRAGQKGRVTGVVTKSFRRGARIGLAKFKTNLSCRTATLAMETDMTPECLGATNWRLARAIATPTKLAAPSVRAP